jgi:hypothetical protein
MFCTSTLSAGPEGHPLLTNGQAELVVTFTKPLSGRERGQLTREGVRFVQALGGSTYVVKTRQDGIEALEGSAYFVSADLVLPESKLSDGLAEGAPGAWALTDDGRINVIVQFYEDVNLGTAVSTLRKNGVDPGHPQKLLFNNRLVVTASQDQVDALAGSQNVRHIGTVPPPAVDYNIVSAQVANVDIVQAPPYSLDGDGVLFGMWESGNPEDTHDALTGRITSVEGSDTDHGTHVAGTILGDGTTDATALGMSPSGDRIYSYTSSGDVADEQSDAVDDYGIVIANHSWGNSLGWEFDGTNWNDTGNDGDFGKYNGTARDWDAMVRSTGLIVDKAAGNDGNDCDPSDATDCDGFAGGDGNNYDNVGTFGNAKNIITVGAINDDATTVTGFSSKGPSDDGRVKPDLVANGAQLWSSCIGNSFCNKSGTSMSTPSVTGAAGLLIQRYRHPANYGTSPSPDVMKALWVNTATDLGRPGPDYVFGHGLIDAQLAVDTIDAGQVRILTDSVDQDDTNEYLVSVPAGVSELRATLNWLDPEASADANPAIINDLDLLVLDWEFASNFPFTGPGMGNVTGNATATGPNPIDTVEHTLVNNPDSGFWRVQVAGTSVPDGPQSYALVVNGYDATGQLVAPLGFVLDTEPDIRVNASLDFNLVCPASVEERVVEIFNVGGADLLVNSVTVTNTGGPSDAFSLGDHPILPFVVKAGAHVDVTILFAPDQDGYYTGELDIESNDADQPNLVIEMTGTGGAAEIDTFIADSGFIGEVCAGLTGDKNLTIQNNGTCPLELDSVTISGADKADFLLPDGSLAGTIIEAGNSLAVPVRFAPDNFTDPSPRTASVDITSSTADDGSLPLDQTPISGTVPPPDIEAWIANSGNFGAVCKGDFSDLDLNILNEGRCDLTISDINSLWNLVVVPDDLTFPLTLSHDASIQVPLRFSPEECFDDPINSAIQILSDDPDEGIVQIDISGESPCPNLVIDPGALSGEFAFPATVVDTEGTLGCFSERSTVLRNSGDCPLTIDDIQAAGADFTVMAPTIFPIILPSGEETLEVTVRFTPQDMGDPLFPDETLGLLTVTSDDPDASGEAELCGEGVTQSGIRTLVTDVTSGVPVIVGSVDSMTVKSKGKNTASPVNMQFTDVEPVTTTVCGNEIQWHLDLEVLPAAGTTGGQGGKSSYSADAREGNLQDSNSFSLGQCEFKEFQLQLRESDAGICLLKQKGEACDTDAECCSFKCKGPDGGKTCK